VHVGAILPQRFAGVQKILLVSFGSRKLAVADAEKFKRELGGSFADGVDGFLVQGGVGDNATSTDILAAQFELRLDQD
jgi:CTP synthase (UTP-ammonia lyase)